MIKSDHEFCPPPYFPSPGQTAQCGVESSFAEAASLALARMREPMLYPPTALDAASGIYRLMCLPSFGSPYCVRVQRTEGTRIAVYKETNGTGGYDPGHLARESTVELSVDQWQRFEEVLDKQYFWSTPLRGLPGGLDGEEWIAEGARANAYRAIYRWGGGTADAILRGLCAIAPDIGR